MWLELTGIDIAFELSLNLYTVMEVGVVKRKEFGFNGWKVKDVNNSFFIEGYIALTFQGFFLRFRIIIVLVSVINEATLPVELIPIKVPDISLFFLFKGGRNPFEKSSFEIKKE